MIIKNWVKDVIEMFIQMIYEDNSLNGPKKKKLYQSL
jgi:hypothetical protein